MFDGKVKSKEHLKLGRSVRSAKIGAQARAAIAKVKSVETQHVRPTFRATAATTEAPAATTTAQRKAASKARRPDRNSEEEPSPDKKTGAKEAPLPALPPQAAERRWQNQVFRDPENCREGCE